MNGGNFNTILDGFRNVEDGEGHNDCRKQRSLGEMHPRTYPASISETHVSRISLGFFLRSCNMPVWVESERVGVGLRIVKHVPADKDDPVSRAKLSKEDEKRHQRLVIIIDPLGTRYPFIIPSSMAV
jgi:hypothetical protein